MEEEITEISGLPLTAEHAFMGLEAGVATTYSFDRPSIHAKSEQASVSSPTVIKKPPITTPARRCGDSDAPADGAASELATEPQGRASATEQKPAPVELAPEAEPCAVIRAKLSKLSPKPRKSCRECRQSPATVKGDRIFVECTLATCSAGFAGYQADLYHAPGKFCSHCLVRRYAYSPAALDPATFKCPVCTHAKVCAPSSESGPKSSKSSKRIRVTAPPPRSATQRKGANPAASAVSPAPSTRKRTRVRPAKRRQTTPMTPLLSVGTTVVTEEGLSGVIIGSGNGFFNVELTREDKAGANHREKGSGARASPVIVKRRGTALQLQHKRQRSKSPQRASDEDQGSGAEALTSKSKGTSAAVISHNSSGDDSNACDAAMPKVAATEKEEILLYTDGVRALDVLRYISAQHPQILREAVDATKASCDRNGSDSSIGHRL